MKIFSPLKKPLVFSAIASLLLLAGCSKTETADNAITTSIELKKISFKQWDDQLKSYRPSVVVVDAWAMWCTSCIKRFPKMVELSEKYRGRNVQFVSLNLDDHTDTESVADAEVFLKKMNATFDNFHIDENLLDAFEKFNLIGIPAVFIYDQNGKESFRLTGDNPNSQFTEKDIEESVLQLLKQS